MELGLRGAFSSVVALGCLASLTVGPFVYADSDTIKNNEEEKKKEKAAKLEKAANALSITNSVSSISGRGFGLDDFSGAFNHELAHARESLDVINNALIAQVLKKVDDDLKKKEEKCAVEEAVDKAVDTIKFFGEKPIKATLGTATVVGGVKGFEVARREGYLDDTLLASLFPDVFKNMNEKRMSDAKYAEAMIGLKEKEVTITDKQLDAEIKRYDLVSKESLVNFYKNHPGVSDAKKYAGAFGDFFGDIGRGVASIVGMFTGGKGS